MKAPLSELSDRGALVEQVVSKLNKNTDQFGRYHKQRWKFRLRDNLTFMALQSNN